MAATYWTNSDGLIVHFGSEGAVSNIAGQVETDSVTQELVIDISDATTIGTAAPSNLINSARIPANSLIVSARLIVNTAFTSGGAATLALGTCSSAGVAIDQNGLIADVAVGSLTADTLVTGAGAQVGTVTTVEAYLYLTYGTAAFTAGTGKIVVTYIAQ